MNNLALHIKTYLTMLIFMAGCLYGQSQNVDSLVQELFLDVEYTDHTFKDIPLLIIPIKKQGTPKWAYYIPVIGGGLLIYTQTIEDGTPDISPPVAADDVISVSCGESVSINVIDNDSGDSIRIRGFDSVPGIDISISGNGNLMILVAGNENFSFDYTIVDQHGQEASATVSVIIVLPSVFAENDETEFAPGSPVSGNVLGNDTGTGLSIISNTQPENGVIEVSPDGSFEYIPGANFCGQDQWSYVARDNCGQEVTGTVVMSGLDIIQPGITCPGPSTAGCHEELDPVITGEPEAEDNCTPNSELLITFEDDLGNLEGCNNTGVIIRVWTVEDLSGNQTQCEQEISVTDLSGPELICPADMIILCGSSLNPSVTGMAEGSDLCGTSEITFFDEESGDGCLADRVIVRTWMATDECGNSTTCEQIITVEADTEPPALTCPPDMILQCGDSTEANATGFATAEDNCSGVESIAISFTDEESGDGCSADRVILRSWKAVDTCGNSSTCEQIITVEADTEPPALTCPPDIVLECGESTETATTGFATAEDNCSLSEGIDISYTDEESGDGCSSDRVIVRTWTGTDACGNSSSCEQIITVAADMEPPVLTCPPDMILQCGESTEADASGFATAEDNCSLSEAIDISYTDEESGDGCSNDRVIVRTWMATDECGNSSTCEQIITVEAVTEPPALTCPPDIVLECGESTETATTGFATAEDNCTESEGIDISYTDEESGDGCSNDRVIVRTWTGTDACGNSSSCEQIIMVEADMEPPVLSCPPDIEIQCDQSEEDVEITGFANAEDNCTPLSGLAIHYSDNIIDDIPCEEVISRTWIAVDLCGNESDCIQTITQVDNQPPTITCPPNISIPCISPTDPENTGFPESTDNCSEEIQFTFDDVRTGECAGVIVRTWTATDQCGNTISCDQIITLEAVPCDFNLEVTKANADCGLNNGTAQRIITPGLNADGPFTTEWSHGPSTQSVNELTPGEYSVLVTDEDLNCSITVDFIISENAIDYIDNVSVTPGICTTSGNILIELNTPGPGPIRVDVFPPGGGIVGASLPKGTDFVLNNYIGNPESGQYVFDIFDAEAGRLCRDRIGVIINNVEADLRIESISVIPPSTSASNDGEVSLSGVSSLPAPPYRVIVNEMFIGLAGSLNFNIEGFTPGEYAIYIIDANGCPSNTVFVGMFPDGEGTDLNILMGSYDAEPLGEMIVRIPVNRLLPSGAQIQNTASEIPVAYQPISSFRTKIQYPVFNNFRLQLEMRMLQGLLNGHWSTYEGTQNWSAHMDSWVMSPSVRWENSLKPKLSIHFDLGLHLRRTVIPQADLRILNTLDVEFLHDSFDIFFDTGLEFKLPDGDLITLDFQRSVENMILGSRINLGYQYSLKQESMLEIKPVLKD